MSVVPDGLLSTRTHRGKVPRVENWRYFSFFDGHCVPMIRSSSSSSDFLAHRFPLIRFHFNRQLSLIACNIWRWAVLCRKKRGEKLSVSVFFLTHYWKNRRTLFPQKQYQWIGSVICVFLFNSENSSKLNFCLIKNNNIADLVTVRGTVFQSQLITILI